MTKAEIILKLSNAQETLDGFRADVGISAYYVLTKDDRWDEVLKMIGECMDALKENK